MDAIFRAHSYSLDPLSAPFMVAAAAVVATSLYVAFMRGSPILRIGFLLLCGGLVPFVCGYALVGSTHDPQTALALYRLSVAFVPLAASGALLFMLALSRSMRQHRTLLIVSFASSAALAVVSFLPGVAIDDVWRTPSGLWYFTVPVNGIAQLHPLVTGVWVAAGVFILWRRLDREPSPVRRRQYKSTMLAFSTFALGLVDVLLAYRIGWYPLSWLFLTLGAVLALRSLVADDLIHGGAIDSRAVWAAVYLIAASVLIGAARWAIGEDADAVVLTVVVLGIFLLLRVAVGMVQMRQTRGARGAVDTLLHRAIQRYASDVQGLRTELEIAKATTDVIELALGGDRTELLLPSQEDYSWTDSSGEVLPEERTPDPMTLMWLLEHAQPIGRDEIETLRLGDLRPGVEGLFEAHEAETLLPLVNRDEVVGMVVLGVLKGGRSLRPDERRFLDKLMEHAAAALVYARMQREATARVEVDKEVELAAAVQSAFVPSSDLVECGRVTLAGTYTPASQCGGDWWSVHELPEGRVLVLIGDVTGHGIAAAMVTAAAKGCYDVAQRLMGDDLDLVRLLELLHSSVRRAGAGAYNMTCFATLLDPAEGRITYANAGHPVPYVCRSTGNGKNKLDVLVARGNPLGANEESRYKSHTRDLSPGDVLVWYTDGIVECANPRRQLFGDRRMQRLLRGANVAGADVRDIRDQVVRAAVVFQEGHPADDDITLVVGRVA